MTWDIKLSVLIMFMLAGIFFTSEPVSAKYPISQSQITALEPDCRSGNAASCEDLFRHYTKVAKTPVHTKESLAAALKKKIDWAEISCAKGSKSGCRLAGWAYENGKDGRSRNLVKAFGLYKKGCENGAHLSCSLMGDFHRFGMGTAKNSSLAQQAYAKACSLRTGKTCPVKPVPAPRKAALAPRKVAVSPPPVKTCANGNLDDCWARYESSKNSSTSNPLGWAEMGCRVGDKVLCFNAGAILAKGSYGNARNRGAAYNYYHQACLKGDRQGCEWRDRTQSAMNSGGSMDANTVRRANDPNGYLGQTGPVCRPVKIIQNGRMHTKTECLDRDVAKKRGWIK